jgi:ribonucleoside-diphosphate reductase alpha chain
VAQSPKATSKEAFDEHAVAIAKRQYFQPGDEDVYGMFHRVANWVASPEDEEVRDHYAEAFYRLMAEKKFCPGGRVLAGAATGHGNVLNCFVQGAKDSDPDSMEGIMEVARKLALVTKVGGGNGVYLGSMRENGAPIKGSGGTASGPVSFLRQIYAPILRVVRQGGSRRGAGMATLDINHPDVLDFITAKDHDREEGEGRIETFNISLLATDKFMEAVKNDEPWYFKSRYKNAVAPPSEVPGKYVYAGHEDLGGKVIPLTPDGGVKARWLLDQIAEHAWATGEPGLIFIDRINDYNAVREGLGEIKATNPCGEIPLLPGEPCDLGAINLARYVKSWDEGTSGFDWEEFRQDVHTCTRFLDNVLEVNHFALADNREMSQRLRRLGLGVMGLADALIKMGYRYDTEEGREAVREMIQVLRDGALEASQSLAKERGVFPDFDKSSLAEPRRNVALLTVAPTGTTSMLMGVSSGIEPVFAPFIYRKIGDEYKALIHPLFKELLEEHRPHPDFKKGDGWDWEAVVNAVQANHGSVQGLEFVPQPVKDVLVCAHDIAALDHVRMQAAVQTSFDEGGAMAANSISKTINMPHEATVNDVHEAYSLAFELGCKGITVYRDGSRDFQVLSTSTKTGKRREDKEKEAAKAEPARLPGEPLFDRPGRLSGFTDNVKLTLATGDRRSFYVTVNKKEDIPIEVFISSGRSGDEANADSEALGRMVSIALQYGVPAEAVVKTLRGINGGMYGSYQGRMVASKADLIAVALETAGVENVLAKGTPCPEGCGGVLVREENCLKCYTCGYSKCG